MTPNTFARALLMVLCLGACNRSDRTPPVPQVAIAGERREERCLVCHAQMGGIGAAHAPEKLGCSACHGGDPAKSDKSSAHRRVQRVPGNLADVSSSCGQAPCHPAEAARVQRSPMTMAAGILAIDKFAFGERATPVAHETDSFERLRGPARSPAEDHARKLCASCHLSVRKQQPGDEGFHARGGGCTACHLGHPVGVSPGQQAHPAVTSDVSERRCEGCHARSGRISLSYRGIFEVEPARASEHLPDARPVRRVEPDVHASAGMTCIDCHTERDVMGDGTFHAHAAEAVEIRCEDCHAPALQRRAIDADAARVADVLRRSWARRKLPDLSRRTPLVLARGTPLYRSDVSTRSLLLAASGRERRLTPLNPEAAYHRMQGHERLGCQACHSARAPRCTGCHTQLDPAQNGFDHLLQTETPGAWSERAGGNDFGPPALALDAASHIVPFVEGMTLQLSLPDRADDQRVLWAPLDPHTTGKARACASCHLDASPQRPVLPSVGETTRVGARLLTSTERARVLRVGSCLPCHESYADRIYLDFSQSERRLGTKARARPGDAIERCRF